MIPAAVRTLLEQNQFIIDRNATPLDLFCTSCKKLTNDAYQSYCGCTYCRDCIISHLANGEIYCKGNKQYCRNQRLILDQNVNRNAMLNNRILNLRVICPNRPCTYSIELISMNDHLRVCTKQPVQCPYHHIGCNDGGLSKDTIRNHIDSGIESHMHILMDWIDQLKNEFNASQVEVKSLQEESIANKVMLVALEREVREKKDKISSLENQLGHCTDRIIAIEERDKKRELEIETLKSELKKRIEILEVNSKNKDDRLIEIERKMKENVTMKDYDDRSNKFENEQKRMEDRLSQIEINKLFDAKDWTDKIMHRMKKVEIGTNSIVAIGIMSFTIGDFDARRNTREAFKSPFFYSHANGYKCQLSVYPGGTDDGAGTHLSVYIVLCSGEYDTILPWPCQSIFTLSITNQLSKEAHNVKTLSYDTSADNQKFVYKMPIIAENSGHGFSKFISHENLRDTDFLVVNDSVVIECIVGPKQ